MVTVTSDATSVSKTLAYPVESPFPGWPSKAIARRRGQILCLPLSPRYQSDAPTVRAYILGESTEVPVKYAPETGEYLIADPQSQTLEVVAQFGNEQVAWSGFLVADEP